MKKVACPHFSFFLQKTKQNAEDFISLLALAKEQKLTTFRLGNSFIPFISHKNFDPCWLADLTYILEATKERLQDFDIRITQHPGQYTVLNSLHTMIIENSLAELKASFWLFDTLGIDENGIILIHGGGAYGDKESALQRLEETIEANSWLKERLALENDEKTYSANEILPLCSHLGIPFVFDIYHHSLNQSVFNVEDFLASYKTRRAKIHLSSKGEGKFGNHGDLILKEDFLALYEMFGERLKNIDIMLEAKAKEKAIEKLRLDIQGATF
ncbi:MAG: UV DNA damage repair endonuclease UvsE [Sulfurospirillum sp.]|nr:UV DNA damage repair endonuclease UvsE [Sulfurospirillum sp.]